MILNKTNILYNFTNTKIRKKAIYEKNMFVM